MWEQGRGVIRKAVIVVLTVACMTTLSAGCLLGRHPTHFEMLGSPTKSFFVSAMIMDGLLRLVVIHSDSPRVIDRFDQLHERPVTNARSGVIQRRKWPFWRFSFDWRSPHVMVEGRWDISGIEFSLVVPAALFAAYPIIAFHRGPLRHWRRRRKGFCQKCGYDLTGNESGTCPECGTEVKA